jgi:hypothetical protein
MADTQLLNALRWNECNDTMAHQLTATTYNTDKVHECPFSALPLNFQKVPGLETVYLSGYCMPLEVFPSLSATGELVSVRLDDETIKTYNYVFAVTDDHRVFWTGPFKDFDLHHIELGSEVPVEKLFGNNPIQKTDQNEG